MRKCYRYVGETQSMNKEKRVYSSLSVCVHLTGTMLQTLDDDMAEATHMLTALVEKKIQGKFVWFSLHHLLQCILKLSTSDANKVKVAVITVTH